MAKIPLSQVPNQTEPLPARKLRLVTPIDKLKLGDRQNAAPASPSPMQDNAAMVREDFRKRIEEAQDEASLAKADAIYTQGFAAYQAEMQNRPVMEWVHLWQEKETHLRKEAESNPMSGGARERFQIFRERFVNTSSVQLDTKGKKQIIEDARSQTRELFQRRIEANDVVGAMQSLRNSVVFSQPEKESILQQYEEKAKEEAIKLMMQANPDKFIEDLAKDDVQIPGYGRISLLPIQREQLMEQAKDVGLQKIDNTNKTLDALIEAGKIRTPEQVQEFAKAHRLPETHTQSHIEGLRHLPEETPRSATQYRSAQLIILRQMADYDPVVDPDLKEHDRLEQMARSSLPPHRRRPIIASLDKRRDAGRRTQEEELVSDVTALVFDMERKGFFLDRGRTWDDGLAKSDQEAVSILDDFDKLVKSRKGNLSRSEAEEWLNQRTARYLQSHDGKFAKVESTPEGKSQIRLGAFSEDLELKHIMNKGVHETESVTSSKKSGTASQNRDKLINPKDLDTWKPDKLYQILVTHNTNVAAQLRNQKDYLEDQAALNKVDPDLVRAIIVNESRAFGYILQPAEALLSVVRKGEEGTFGFAQLGLKAREEAGLGFLEDQTIKGSIRGAARWLARCTSELKQMNIRHPTVAQIASQYNFGPVLGRVSPYGGEVNWLYKAIKSGKIGGFHNPPGAPSPAPHPTPSPTPPSNR